MIGKKKTFGILQYNILKQFFLSFKIHEQLSSPKIYLFPLTPWASIKFITTQGDPAFRTQMGYHDALCSPLKTSVVHHHVLCIVISIIAIAWL